MVLLDSQLLLIYNLIWSCRRQRISRYSLGRSPFGSRCKLDGVSLELFYNEKWYRYLFSIRQRQYIRKNISYEALMDSSSDFSLARYFEAYLRLKSELEFASYEIAVWTEAAFRKRDLEMQQILELLVDGSGMPDLLENELLGIKGYRIKSNVELEEKLFKSVDPLYKLADKIARLLLAKLPIGPRNTSNEAFSWLEEHVFEQNSFKKQFLAENSTPSAEVQLFRGYLEAVLHQQFQRKHISDFQLSRIEQPPYSSHIEIHLKDHSITSDSQKRGWNFQNTSTIADARSFLASLVCYTNVPTAQTFQRMIHQRCSFNENIYSELGRFFKYGITLNEKQINAIFEMDEFRKNKPYWVNDNLQFKLESLMTLEAKLKQFSVSKSARLIMVKAGGSIRLTLERIARVAEELLPSKRFIFVKDSKCDQLDKLLIILEGLEFVIDEIPVAIVPYTSDEIGLNKIKRVTKICQAVLVVDHSQVVEDGDLVIHKDNYSFEDFTSDTKESLLSKNILLQGREYCLTSLLSESNLNAIPMEAVINWNACEQIILGSPSYPKDQLDHFIERNLNSESGDVLKRTTKDLNCITILSGEPGIGKSVFLEKMSQESQHKHCVSILLNCRTKSNLFNRIGNISEVLLNYLEVKKDGHFQIFLLQTLVEEKRINLFLDDFDNFYESKATLGLIQNLGFHSVVITVGSHFEALLKTNLTNSVVFYLKPFNESDQINFLKHRWKKVYSDEKQLENVIQSFQTTFEKDFLKIPFNLRIVAMIHEDNDFTINTKNIPKIVEVFIDKMFSLHCEQFFNLSCRAHEIALNVLRATLEEDHARLAFALKCGLEIDREMIRKLYPLGLLRLDGNKVTFAESAFQKYYVVKFLLTHYVEQKYFSRLLGEVFASSLLVDVLDHHIASVDSKRDLLGESKVLECSKSFTLRPNQKLNEFKVKQFFIFFQLDCCERQVIDFIYSSLVNNKLNVFEVIYDSLPINVFKNIRFKCCPNDANPNSIDLSSISEDDLVILLAILSKKHSKDFVERVLTNFTNEEPDFVTIAIKNGFMRVIEQLFCINQGITSQEEVEHLQDYIEQRWREYLKLAMVNNRIKIVQIVLSCTAKKYHQRNIKAFLMEQLVLHALAGVCQHVEDSALEIVQLVVQFVEAYLSDYDLSSMTRRKCDGSNLRELVDNIASEKLQSVFETLF